MPSRVLRTFDIKRQFKIGHFNPFDKCDVVRAADFWFVVTVSAINTKDVVSIVFSVSPTLGIRHLPAFVTFLKILLKNEG